MFVLFVFFFSVFPPMSLFMAHLLFNVILSNMSLPLFGYFWVNKQTRKQITGMEIHHQ